MKTMRSVLTAILITAMVLATCLTVSADGGEGEITITNPTAGEMYAAYKVFDLHYTTGGDGGTIVSYTYEKTAGEDSFFTTLEGEDSPFQLTLTATKDVYYVELKEGKTTNDIVKFLATSVEGRTPADTKKAGAGDPTVTLSVPYGYYYVTSTTGAVVSLTSTMPEVEIVDKNAMDFEKEQKTEEAGDYLDDTPLSVQVGDTVYYRLTGTVPNYDSFATYTYQIADTMSEGLTFQKDVVVKVDGNALVAGEGYTITNKGNGFTLEIDVLGEKMRIGVPIEVTYTAVVNEEAVSRVSENDVVLTYSNDPTDETSIGEIPDEERVYSAKLVIDKHETDSKETKLSGAKFVLYKEEGSVKNYYHYTPLGSDQPAKVTWSPLASGETLEAVLAEGYTGNTKITAVTTNEKGSAAFGGLEGGTYYLQEVDAPSGYKLLQEPVEVTIDGEDAKEENLTVTVQVANTPGALLPSTGGGGTTWFYVAGGALLLAGGIALAVILRRKHGKG